MTEAVKNPGQAAGGASLRRQELLDAAYRYALTRGLADLSLRPLASAIGSSPRVLLFLFGSKDGLLRALLQCAREDELLLLAPLIVGDVAPLGLAAAVKRTWLWLCRPAHRPLLHLWVEAYARSLIDPTGAWAGFAEDTVHDWMEVLRRHQTPGDLETDQADVALALAVLRGALLHLLATGDGAAACAAVDRYLTLDASRG